MSVNEMANLGDRLLVIFDGHCGFCNRAVRWFVRRDRHDGLRFVASQAPVVADLLARQRIQPANLSGADATPNTILVVSGANGPNEHVTVRSDAAVAMLRQLPAPWSWIGALMRWIPRPLRDLGYRLVARWRYRLWGRLDSCPIPTADERRHFL